MIINTITCIFRGNEERLKKFGKAVSLQAKQSRAKRIEVNVKVNSLAYTAEVLGGFVIGVLALVPPATYLYTATIIWYGNIIPSCYLINSSDMKNFIIDLGWSNALSNLYKKRLPKDRPTSSHKKNLKVKVMDSSSKDANVDTIGQGPNGKAFTSIPYELTDNTQKRQEVNDEDKPYHAKCRGNQEVILTDLDYTNVNCTTENTHSLLNQINNDRTLMCKGRALKTANREPSVFYINDCSSNSLTHAAENKSPSILLPNEVDYS